MGPLSRLNCLVIAISTWIFLVQAEQAAVTVPAQLYLNLQYKPLLKSHSEAWKLLCPHDNCCEIFFIVCLENDPFNITTCSIARSTTAVSEGGKFALSGNGLLHLHIINRVPHETYLRIQVWCHEKTSSDYYIGTYGASASFRHAMSKFYEIVPGEHGTSFINADAKLYVWLRMDCSTNYYGDFCTRYCKTDNISFRCDNDGNKICYPGYRGRFCEKRDNCFYEPCAENAKCVNTDDGIGRTCSCNEGSGPECYRVADMCYPSPCKNGGICKITGPHEQQFLCECSQHYFGATCSQRFSWCEAASNAISVVNSVHGSTTAELCGNRGTCIDLPTEFGHTCSCARGWKGQDCEEPDWTAAIVTPVVLLLLLLLIGILLHIYWKIYKSKRPTPTNQLIQACYAWCTTKPVSADKNVIHTSISKKSKKFQNKKKIHNASPPQMSIQDLVGNENEYDCIAEVLPQLAKESQKSSTSIRYVSESLPKIPGRGQGIGMTCLSTADDYEEPTFNSSGGNQRDTNNLPKIPGIGQGIGMTFLSTADDYEEPKFNSSGGNQIDTNNSLDNETKTLEDANLQSLHLTQLPVNVSTTQ